MNNASPHRAVRPNAGFTLIEALLATSILTISVVALSETLLATYRTESNVRRQEQAILLAKNLADQVAAKPLSAAELAKTVPAAGAVAMRSTGSGSALEPGAARVVDPNLFRAPASLANAPTIDALNGASDSVYAPVAEHHPASGTYTRTITITRHKTPAGPVDATGGLRRITVTVTDPGGQSHHVSRIRVPVVVK